MIIQTRGQIIELRGAMRCDHTRAVRDAAHMLLRRNARLVIDCSGITDWNTRGLATLSGLIASLRAARASIGWIGLTEDLQQALEGHSQAVLPDEVPACEQPVEASRL